jgi:serine O-acetyltransferase
MFEKLVKINCHSKNKILKKAAHNLLEKFYCCEINCTEIDESVLFAHHARGCIIIASNYDSLYNSNMIHFEKLIEAKNKYDKE